MLVEGCKVSIKNASINEPVFNQLKRNKDKEEVLSKPFKECNLEMYENRKKALELTYQHLWTRKDSRKFKNQCEIIDDHKHNNCAKCRKEKVVREFAIYGSKYYPKLCKT